MAKVEVLFEVELPFWLSMDDGKYDINIDNKIWPIELYNDKWHVAMSNEIDHKKEESAYPNNRKEAEEIHKIFKDKDYYHKEKLKTVLKTGFGWEIAGSVTRKDAKEKFENEFDWCKKTLLERINRFIEIYRTTEPSNKIPHVLSYFDLSNNWIYSIFLDGNWIEGGRIGYNIYHDLRSPPPKVEKEIQNKIILKLKNGFLPPTGLLMFENALGLHERGRYRNAIVEITSAFDIFLVDFLNKEFEKKKYEEQLIKYLISRCKDFNFMLKEGLKIAKGKSFGEIDDKLLDKFKQEVLKLRNDVIHRGIKVTQKESENAIKIINEMMSKIIHIQ